MQKTEEMGRLDGHVKDQFVGLLNGMMHTQSRPTSHTFEPEDIELILSKKTVDIKDGVVITCRIPGAEDLPQGARGLSGREFKMKKSALTLLAMTINGHRSSGKSNLIAESDHTSLEAVLEIEVKDLSALRQELDALAEQYAPKKSAGRTLSN